MLFDECHRLINLVASPLMCHLMQVEIDINELHDDADKKNYGGNLMLIDKSLFSFLWLI